jgi:hypothetical protein
VRLRLRTCEERPYGACQGGLAREVGAFERYEDAPLCTLRGLRSGPFG